jgi:methylase of polypeptide subunit release factors
MAGRTIACKGCGVDERANALVELGRALQDLGYVFVTPTPETHRRVNARALRSGRGEAQDVRDVFGWNRPFRAGLLPERLLTLLQTAEALVSEGPLLRAQVRFSSLGGGLFVHSAFPTEQSDAVFFGPDTYRFCSLLQRWAPAAKRLVDVGCGSGAGGLCVRERAAELVLADINQRALAMAEVNAALAGSQVVLVESNILASVRGAVDLVIANPPYMRDPLARTYRDGGGSHGEQLAVRIVHEAIERLSPGGTLIVYTGSAIVAGRDVFLSAVTPLLASLAYDYEELDPDVFGEELEQPAYEDVERIAAVGLRVRR